MSSLKEILKSLGITVGVIAIATTIFYLYLLLIPIIIYMVLFSPLILLGAIPYVIYRYIREKRRQRKNEKSSSRSIRGI
jgi:predicted membrane protein